MNDGVEDYTFKYKRKPLSNSRLSWELGQVNNEDSWINVFVPHARLVAGIPSFLALTEVWGWPSYQIKFTEASCRRLDASFIEAARKPQPAPSAAYCIRPSITNETRFTALCATPQATPCRSFSSVSNQDNASISVLVGVAMMEKSLGWVRLTGGVREQLSMMDDRWHEAPMNKIPSIRTEDNQHQCFMHKQSYPYLKKHFIIFFLKKKYTPSLITSALNMD